MGNGLKLATTAAPHFNLALTLESGQVFHWHPIGVGWVGTIGSQPVYVEQSGKSLRVTAGMERGRSGIISPSTMPCRKSTRPFQTIRT